MVMRLGRREGGEGNLREPPVQEHALHLRRVERRHQRGVKSTSGGSAVARSEMPQQASSGLAFGAVSSKRDVKCRFSVRWIEILEGAVGYIRATWTCDGARRGAET